MGIPGSVKFLRILYCLQIITGVFFSVYYLTHLNLIWFHWFTGSCLFLSMMTVCIMQVVFYENLPVKILELLLLLFAPYFWMLLQYELDPLPFSFYLISSGISYLISFNLSFLFFILIRTFIFDRKYYYRHVLRNISGKTNFSVTFIVLLQIILFVIPGIIISSMIGRVLIRSFLFSGNDLKSIDLLLWMMNIAHNCFHYYKIYLRMSYLQKEKEKGEKG